MGNEDYVILCVCVCVFKVWYFSGLLLVQQVGENLQELIEAEAEAEREDIRQKKRTYQLLMEKAQREKELAEKEREEMGATWGMGAFQLY